MPRLVKPRSKLQLADAALIQIVDAALADGAALCGEWLVCRPGCCQCCTGVFTVNQLDAARLKQGIAALHKLDPARASAIRARASDSIVRLAATFPGNTETGTLDPAISHAGSDAQALFEDFGNDEVCPVLNPETGQCELYDSRPMTCRTFGPPVRSEDGLGVCELCFQGATDAEIAACEVVPDRDDLEAAVVAQAEDETGTRGQTIVAYCVR